MRQDNRMGMEDVHKRNFDDAQLVQNFEACFDQ